MKAVKNPGNIANGTKIPEMKNWNLLPVINEEMNCSWVADIINASVKMFYVKLATNLFELIVGHEGVLENKDGK